MSTSSVRLFADLTHAHSHCFSPQHAVGGGGGGGGGREGVSQLLPALRVSVKQRLKTTQTCVQQMHRD